MDDVPSIPGADALAVWFGSWPSFHDAEIHELHLDRQRVSWLKIHTWRMTDRVDDKGYYVLEKHVMVTFNLKGVTTLVLDDFSHQNVISELVIEQVRDGLVMTLEPCYGLSGMIEAKEISIEFTPIAPSWGPFA